MNLQKIEIVYFLGIGGIGMSALARYFHHQKKIVLGYDRTPTALTAELEMEGIAIHYDDSILEIPQILKVTDREKILVIYTPAIPQNNAEKNWLIDHQFYLAKRSEVLGLITAQSPTIAVAGTHGKTTTSTMIAHLLKSSSIACNAFLGGISSNYGTNLLLGNIDSLTVVEADEFDRSFLTLFPKMSVITSMDADHLDIYGDDQHVKEGFNLFAQKITEGGFLLYKKGLPLDHNKIGNAEICTYSLEEQADYQGLNIRIKNGKYYFDLKGPNFTISDLVVGLPGRHNVENAIAASVIALRSGVTPDQLREGLATFRGAHRRFEYIVENQEITYIDDYAHHPTELKAAIQSARELFPNKKITGIFQPHLYSRTRDFMNEFAQSLDLLDEIILLPIYPAREMPIDGVSSEVLFSLLKNKNKHLLSKSEVVHFIQRQHNEVLLTLGAGDIDTLVGEISKSL